MIILPFNSLTHLRKCKVIFSAQFHTGGTLMWDLPNKISCYSELSLNKLFPWIFLWLIIRLNCMAWGMNTTRLLYVCEAATWKIKRGLYMRRVDHKVFGWPYLRKDIPFYLILEVRAAKTALKCHSKHRMASFWNANHICLQWELFTVSPCI